MTFDWRVLSFPLWNARWCVFNIFVLWKIHCLQFCRALRAEERTWDQNDQKVSPCWRPGKFWKCSGRFYMSLKVLGQFGGCHRFSLVFWSLNGIEHMQNDGLGGDLWIFGSRSYAFVHNLPFWNELFNFASTTLGNPSNTLDLDFFVGIHHLYGYNIWGPQPLLLPVFYSSEHEPCSTWYIYYDHSTCMYHGISACIIILHSSWLARLRVAVQGAGPPGKHGGVLGPQALWLWDNTVFVSRFITTLSPLLLLLFCFLLCSYF